jgi:hypothetical protein
MAQFTYPSVTIDTSGLATEAKQDIIITELQEVNTELDGQSASLTSIDGKVATETTLASVDGKVATETTLAALETKAATETTLASVDGKVATEVTLASIDTKVSTAANQATGNASLSNIESDINSLNARLAGNLVPEEFDYLAFTYVAAGNGAGEIETVTYRTGGAAGTIVATLTLGYDAQDRLASVTRS